MEKEAGRELVVVGAGRCNDIDLTHLLEFFESVVLVDVDSAGMQKVFERVPEALRGKVGLKEDSLTGITETDVAAFCGSSLDEVQRQGKKLTLIKLEAIMEQQLAVVRQEEVLSSEMRWMRSIPWREPGPVSAI